MLRLLRQELLVLVMGTLCLSSCAIVQPGGERFGISTVGRESIPKLQTASLISGDKKVMVFGVNSGNSYHQNDGIKIPEEVEFMWRALGEKEAHLEKIKLRSQIPENVLMRIEGRRPAYYLSIEFFVRNNSPLFRWKLTELFPGQTSGFKEVNRGGDWQ
jgi:hypothetical protein